MKSITDFCCTFTAHCCKYPGYMNFIEIKTMLYLRLILKSTVIIYFNSNEAAMFIIVTNCYSNNSYKLLLFRIKFPHTHILYTIFYFEISSFHTPCTHSHIWSYTKYKITKKDIMIKKLKIKKPQAACTRYFYNLLIAVVNIHSF